MSVGQRGDNKAPERWDNQKPKDLLNTI